MKTTWIVRASVAIFLAGLLDGVSTFVATPDLSCEANPVLLFFGRTWSNLMVLKTLASLVAVAAFAGGLRILESRRDRLAGYAGFRNVLSQLIFRRRVSLGAFLLYGWPRDWIALFAVACMTIAVATITAGFTATLTNSFKVIRSKSHLIAYWCSTGALSAGLAIWLTYRFFEEHAKTEPASDGNAARSAPQT